MANKFLIAGIGSSAGGVEALSALIKSLPKNIGMAFILIQHLEPQHESILPSILARQTVLNVCQATDNVKVEPAHIYIIPPNSYLDISSGKLRLSPRHKYPEERFLPIDFFFASLANDQGKKALGIILSGTGTDGTKGIKTIKANGGITFAQNRETAKYSGMPESAIESGAVDYVLPPRSIALEIARISMRKSTRAKPTARSAASEEDALEQILLFLGELTGVDFIHYKRTTLVRRIARRLAVLKLDHYTDYYAHLQNDPNEAALLHKDILIQVTSFFRDSTLFEMLKKKVFPRLATSRTQKNPIRIWVPGCSTGEEVYSLAISLHEFLDENRLKTNIQIFGTDVSEASIQKARSASYGDDISEHISRERLRRFFIKTETGYKISKQIRDLCIFAKQDITSDPALSNMDIVSCRNILIYFDTVLQRKAFAMLHYALKPHGFLLLGTSESVGQLPELFAVIDKKNKIFEKKVIASARDAISRIDLSVSKAYTNTIRKTVALPVAGTGKAKRIERASKPADSNSATRTKIRKKPGSQILQANKGKAYASALAKKLEQTKKELYDIIQDKDTINEELQAANEEVQSSNEELQSLNEELETSKEELQSTNEELLTLNDELQNRNAELTQLNSDLANVLASTNVPMIMVGMDLRIRRFTPMARKAMNLIEADIGRPLGDIALNIDIENLDTTASDVIETMIPWDSEVRDKEGRWYSIKVRPYRTLENKIDGAVIIMIDIDENKRMQIEMNDALDFNKAVIETIREPLLILDENFHVISANKSFCRHFKIQVSDIIKRSIFEIEERKWDIPKLRGLLGDVLPDNLCFDDYEVEYSSSKVGGRKLLLSGRRIDLDGKKTPMMLLAIEDVTERRLADEILAREKSASEIMSLQVELARAKRLSDIGTLAATVAHELRNPLAAINLAAFNIKRKDAEGFLKRSLDTIVTKVSESAQIINNLLFYSRIKPPHLIAADIFSLIDECIESQLSQTKKKVTITKNYEAIIGTSLKMDPLQMKEVFQNVIDNALDAVTEETGLIEVNALKETKAVKIIIKDNGFGMDNSVIEKAFDPFFTTKATGTGLGLSVCKQIMQLHNGSIDIESSPNKGTSLIISIPMKCE
jgi:two-component system, chemotaxis family, CheB/CheR fusion protein